jgi:hypothetical protein
VKTDGRDGRALCLRLDRYLAGNKNSLAVIRVPSEEEERARHWGREGEQLVHHRQKMEAQGRDLLDWSWFAGACTLVEGAKLEPLGQASTGLDTVSP